MIIMQVFCLYINHDYVKKIYERFIYSNRVYLINILA